MFPGFPWAGSNGGPASTSESALPELVALAAHFQDVDIVGDAVEQSAGEALAGEDRGPLLEGQVGGDDRGSVLVALAEHVEQQLAPGLQGAVRLALPTCVGPAEHRTAITTPHSASS